MILIGTARMMSSIEFMNTKVEREDIYNFTGLIEWIPRSILVPDTALGATSEYDFDMKYADWLLSDNLRFFELFKIASKQINGGDNYIIISEMANEYTFAYNIVESFVKFMQFRYGCRSLYIRDDSDWELYRESITEDNIIPVDQYIVNDDFMRYCSLIEFKE